MSATVLHRMYDQISKSPSSRLASQTQGAEDQDEGPKDHDQRTRAPRDQRAKRPEDQAFLLGFVARSTVVKKRGMADRIVRLVLTHYGKRARAGHSHSLFLHPGVRSPQQWLAQRWWLQLPRPAASCSQVASGHYVSHS